jgi:hypothetical protein
MSASQLDILALEPFYGGARRIMLDAMIHCSRHRWTLLKLPPRRIERRLSAAAHWFAEQLSRHWVGRTNLLFTSEAMNLSDLYRLVPGLLKLPSVVYFHDNQLPHVDASRETPLDFVNLNTAAAASEIWFNSLYHLRTFLARASALVKRHPDLAARSPLPDLTAKAQVMPPPLGSHFVQEIALAEHPKRERRNIFVETRDADMNLLNNALGTVLRRGEKFHVTTVGPVEQLLEDLPRTTLAETDELGHIRGMLKSNLFISARTSATSDHHAVRALLAGCWPIVPQTGVYRELLPEVLHSSCLYDNSYGALASRMQDAWHLERVEGYENEMVEILRRFDPIVACRAMDDRLHELAMSSPVGAK